jgi:very-short-patch-repair endonuclease/16S rRNA G966 N2-methylase RsmD
MARSATKQRIAQAQNGANHIGDKERRFFDALKNIFVGVPVEGESGYINLMRIKARYFEKVMEPHLRKEIDNALKHFPDFREELFDKLYTFFRRYFTESGSIGFFFTPYHQSVYEQVYTNEQDVVLFWKTARLYYVKTDRLFQSMTVEVDGFRFHFDVSQLEHKRANEKRELIYAYKERQQDGTIVFTVHYSEKGRKTNIDDIRRAIRDALGLTCHTDAVPTEEILQKAFRIFERQSEVDYFLCKDAKSFLREQFDLWMWQYLLGKPGEKPQTEWEETRLAQLQALKRIAYRVIDYIAAFEDELVKIWNKPKFVLNSHYVITLDRIAAQPGGVEMLERLWAHPNMETQLQEWRELGMVSEDFTLEDLLLPPSAASNPQQDLFEVAEARDLITNGYHLPYNPDLVERARELRRNMTPAERQLWEYLKHAPYRFLRQRPIDHFIVDFYCPALRLVIEVDGEQHYTEEGKAYDAERDTILQSYGLRVVRFRNEEVLRHFESVRQRIEAVFESPLTPSLSPLSKGGEGAGGAESPLTPSLSPLSKGGEGAGGAESPLTPSLSPLSKGGEGAGSGGIHPRYRYLPIDTKHFPDLELPIVALFDNLDEALDGWLIKSENYQALNTILPKFREKVQTIYIDPPYNTGISEIDYINRFKSSSWLSMIENRITIGRKFLTNNGLLCMTIDHVELHNARCLINAIFGEDNVLGLVSIVNNPSGRSTVKGFSVANEYAIFVGNSEHSMIGMLPRTEEQKSQYKLEDEKGPYQWRNFMRAGGANDFRTARPKLFYPLVVDRNKKTIRIPNLEWDHQNSLWVMKDSLAPDEQVVYPTAGGVEYTWRLGIETLREKLSDLRVRQPSKDRSVIIEIKFRPDSDGVLPKTIWDNKLYNATAYGTSLLREIMGKPQAFSFPKSVYAVSDCIRVCTSDKNARVLDFFAGSGTTAHAVINLNREDGGRRKYILVEMADYFYKVLLPRVKKVVFSDKWKDGKAQPDGKGISHFVKYYELEQFEDALRRTRYAEDDLFTPPANEDPCQYIFLRDLKMLEALEVNLEQGTVQVDLSKLYENIDLPETLSNLTGKWIRRIDPDPNNPRVPAAVVFADGERVELRSLDWRRIKPLIWW